MAQTCAKITAMTQNRIDRRDATVPPLVPAAHPVGFRTLALPGPHYVLFTAVDDPATGVSWCPDCVRCCPAVKAAMATLVQQSRTNLLENEYNRANNREFI